MWPDGSGRSTRRVDTVVPDRTGTVTTGRMSLVAAHSPGTDETDVLRLAGALEHASEHPVARAVADAALAGLGTLPVPEDFRAVPARASRGRSRATRSWSAAPTS